MDEGKVRELLTDPEVRESVKRIIEYEERREQEFKTNPIYQGVQGLVPAWELMDVPVEWKIVRKLLMAGAVKRITRRDYVLTDREKIKQMIEEIEKIEEEQVRVSEQEEEFKIPDDLFEPIEGFDDIKFFIKKSLESEEPVHVLLWGPPGTAKTLFLTELERLPGAVFITAGTSTKVGIRDILMDMVPRILIIDEIDKINDAKDLSVLLTRMESGRVIVAKHGMRAERRGKGWIFAACNSIRGLPPELLDRFQVFKLREYTPEEFRRVVVAYLTKRMGIPRDLAEYIAEKVGEYSTSVREAIRVARLAKTKEEVDKILEIIKKYR